MDKRSQLIDFITKRTLEFAIINKYVKSPAVSRDGDRHAKMLSVVDGLLLMGCNNKEYEMVVVASLLETILPVHLNGLVRMTCNNINSDQLIFIRGCMLVINNNSSYESPLTCYHGSLSEFFHYKTNPSGSGNKEIKTTCLRSSQYTRNNVVPYMPADIKREILSLANAVFDKIYDNVMPNTTGWI